MADADLVGPFVEACRKHGLKVGIYYSPPDWYADRQYRSFNYRDEDQQRFPGRQPFNTRHEPCVLPPRPPEHERRLREVWLRRTEELLTRVWPGLVVNPETVVQRVKMLRDALDDPAAEPRYITALRGRGYRLVAEVSKAEAPLPAASVEPASRPPDRRRLVIFAAAALALLAALGFWALQRGTPSPSSAPGTDDPAFGTVAVLPFKNLSSDSADAAIALGVPVTQRRDL